jgi:hypothetical protein
MIVKGFIAIGTNYLRQKNLFALMVLGAAAAATDSYRRARGRG